MHVVPGISLKNLEPRVSNPESPFFIPQVKALMVSYAELATCKSRMRRACETGLCRLLHAMPTHQIYLDNGSFAFRRKEYRITPTEFYAFVTRALPD